jgi:hypothetical protein
MLWLFGIFFRVLVCCTKKNLATLLATWTGNGWKSRPKKHQKIPNLCDQGFGGSRLSCRAAFYGREIVQRWKNQAKLRMVRWLSAIEI